MKTSKKVTVLSSRWSAAAVLATARRRTKAITDAQGSSKDVMAMLEEVLKEAGWKHDDFIEALVRDAEAKFRAKRAKAPTTIEEVKS